MKKFIKFILLIPGLILGIVLFFFGGLELLVGSNIFWQPNINYKMFDWMFIIVGMTSYILSYLEMIKLKYQHEDEVFGEVDVLRNRYFGPKVGPIKNELS